jgi:hypothetical protein
MARCSPILNSTTTTAAEYKTAVLVTEVIHRQLFPSEDFMADKASPKALMQPGDGTRAIRVANFVAPKHFDGVLRAGNKHMM